MYLTIQDQTQLLSNTLVFTWATPLSTKTVQLPNLNLIPSQLQKFLAAKTTTTSHCSMPNIKSLVSAHSKLLPSQQMSPSLITNSPSLTSTPSFSNLTMSTTSATLEFQPTDGTHKLLHVHQPQHLC